MNVNESGGLASHDCHQGFVCAALPSTLRVLHLGASSLDGEKLSTLNTHALDLESASKLQVPRCSRTQTATGFVRTRLGLGSNLGVMLPILNLPCLECLSNLAGRARWPHMHTRRELCENAPREATWLVVVSCNSAPRFRASKIGRQRHSDVAGSIEGSYRRGSSLSLRQVHKSKAHLPH